LVQVIAKRLSVTDKDVIDMNRRLGGDASLNAPLSNDGETGEYFGATLTRLHLELIRLQNISPQSG
jgi:DNA-directed RNA polymerase sigma subunit (sigma70/sigma32)